jgi:HEAT repeat protein
MTPKLLFRTLCYNIAACGLIVFAQTARPPASGVDKAWSLLDAGVKEKGFEKRSQAIGALGLLQGYHRAESMAVAALKDPNSDVRAAAAHALGEMEAKGSIEALKDALTDSDPVVILAIASSLHSMNDPAAFAVYYEILTGERKSKGGLKSEIKVIHDPKKMAALGIDAGVGFIPFGGLGWGVLKFFSKDDVSPVRASAAAVLSKDPDEQTGQALSTATDDKKWLVEVSAIRALALRGGKKYLDVVSAKMASERPIVSYTAAAAVIRLNGRTTAKKATAAPTHPRGSPRR